jgi:hypothetical protein
VLAPANLNFEPGHLQDLFCGVLFKGLTAMDQAFFIFAQSTVSFVDAPIRTFVSNRRIS